MMVMNEREGIKNGRNKRYERKNQNELNRLDCVNELDRQDEINRME